MTKIRVGLYCALRAGPVAGVVTEGARPGPQNHRGRNRYTAVVWREWQDTRLRWDGVGKTKKVAEDTAEKATAVAEDESSSDSKSSDASGTSGSSGDGATAKKSAMGAKEVPAFQWKLLGTANYATLTLFKSVERDDAEAQLERVHKDGYYKDLKIVDIDAKVAQPKQPAALRKKAEARAKKEANEAKKAAAKSKKKTARPAATIKISTRPSVKKAKAAAKAKAKAKAKTTAKKAAKKAAPKKKKAAAKTAKKSAKASPKKKAASKKSTAKKAAAKKTTAKKAAAKKKTKRKKK